MRDVARTENLQRVDRGDYEFAAADTPLEYGRELGESFLADPSGTRRWVVDGFAMDNPAVGQLRVLGGIAILAYRERGAVKEGAFHTGGDTQKIVDVSALADATYNVYLRFELNDAAFQNRVFWNPGSSVEFAQNTATKRVANWGVRLALALPGAEWTLIGTATVTGGDVTGQTDDRPLYFEGTVSGTYARVWGGGDDRDADRQQHGTKDLRTALDALTKKVEEIQTGTNPAITTRRWWDVPLTGSLDDMLPLSGTATSGAVRGVTEWDGDAGASIKVSSNVANADIDISEQLLAIGESCSVTVGDSGTVTVGPSSLLTFGSGTTLRPVDAAAAVNLGTTAERWLSIHGRGLLTMVNSGNVDISLVPSSGNVVTIDKEDALSGATAYVRDTWDIDQDESTFSYTGTIRWRDATSGNLILQLQQLAVGVVGTIGTTLERFNAFLEGVSVYGSLDMITGTSLSVNSGALFNCVGKNVASLLPNATETINLGSATDRWSNVHVNVARFYNVAAAFAGNIFADGGTSLGLGAATDITVYPAAGDFRVVASGNTALITSEGYLDLVGTPNGLEATARRDVLSPRNIPKAWGTVDTDGTITTDGFNVTSVAVDGGDSSSLIVTLAQDMATAEYCVLAQFWSQTTAPINAGLNVQVHSKAVGSFKLRLMQTTATEDTTVDWNATNYGCDFVVFGIQ
jgi:hypothetical protein